MKKLNFLCAGISSLVLISSPLLALLENQISTQKQRIEVLGFNIITPTIAKNETNPSLAPIVGLSFINNPLIPLPTYLEEGGDRFLNNSKTFIHDERFIANFYKTLYAGDLGSTGTDPLEPTSILTVGMGETQENGITKTILAPGTGITSSNISPGVVGAQLTGNILWLLTHGKFESPVAIEDQYMLQTFRFEILNNTPRFTSIGNSQIINFQGNAETRLNINPPVLSPVYAQTPNGDVVVNPNSMIIWQQNLDFNTQVSGVAQEFSIVNDNLSPSPRIINIGTLPNNSKTLALTAINSTQGTNYYVHHNVIGTNDIMISQFYKPWISSRYKINNTLPSNEIKIGNIDTTGIQVNNQVSYAKVVKKNNTTIELVWILPQTSSRGSHSSIFSTPIINSLLSTNLKESSSFSELVDLTKIKYIDIGSFNENNSLLALEVKNPINSLATQPAMFNLSKFKNGDNVLTLIGGEQNSPSNIEAFNKNIISKITDRNIYFNVFYNDKFSQQIRDINDLTRVVYNTTTPQEIVTKINLNHQKFDPKTSIKDLSLIIGAATTNAINSTMIIDDPDSLPIEIIDKVFNVENGSFEIIFRYRDGQYISDGQYLSPPDPNLYIKVDENKLSPLPEVSSGVSPFQEVALFQEPENGFIPLKHFANISSIKNMAHTSPDNFAKNINNLTGEGGSLPEGFQNLSDFQGIIGYQESDIIQISQAYLSFSKRIIVQPDNFLGKAQIELVLNPGLNPADDITLQFILNGFFGQYLIIAITVPLAIVLIAIILLIIFLVQARKKKKQLSKVLIAGFTLNEKIRITPSKQVKKPSQQGPIKNLSQKSKILPPLTRPKK